MILCALLLIANQAQVDKEISMPFVKLESLGKNPLIESEKTIYKSSCASGLELTFKSAPVYMVYYDGKEEKSRVQVGQVSCVFKGGSDKWLTAVMKIQKDIPESYVLRAKFVATEAEYNFDKVLEVRKCTITEFYLKPKDKATVFSD